MRERRTNRRAPYGFLLDRDVAKAASLFPYKRTKTIEDVGLTQNAPDSEIVRTAWSLELTIVTGNGDDFKREFLKFLSQTTRKECHEMRGLVVLPNGFEHQRRFLHGIEKTLRLGREKLTWADVADLDCYVKLQRSGRATISRFPRCFFCKKNEER